MEGLKVGIPTPPPAPASAEGIVGGGMSAALSNLTLERDVYNLDFDALTYNELLVILKKVTHTQMDTLVAQEQQTQLQDQQDGQRLEKFLDSGIEYKGSNVSSPHLQSPRSEDNGYSWNKNNDDGYTYHAMLTHLFEALNRNNEGSAMTERNPIPVPILEKIGKKKTAISNFGRICDAFHRSMEDVKDFIEKELSIRGNLDSNNALILKFEIRKATDFDRTLVKYLDEYVKCYSCHRIDTTLTKDGRRLELRCNWCTATRTVQAASSATYRAQIEKRSRQRAAMTL
ncbi:unnamed protein product [Phytomonas sp. Hart1]|nr:unnamed protein product [Phytomonas sp. Hart1]|eukprot:CCW68500.1 unnamed protein product [Phytomonas sp. isolate Hart1]